VKILVTGAAGMVGRNLSEGIKKSGAQLLAPNRKDLDLFNYEQTENYLKRHSPDMIVHCAGRVGGIQANMAKPVSFLVENIDINRNLFLAAKNTGVKKAINLASSCLYPRSGENPLTEELILKGELEPTNEGYAIAKIFALKLCQYIERENSEFQYKTLIPCNLYGPYDKFSPDSSHLVPAIIQKIDQAIKQNQSEVEIWGDGTARREFMYVGDLVLCLLKGIENFDTLPRVMNVGIGKDYSVNEYYQSAAKTMGYKGRFIHNLEKPVGMKQKLVSTAKADAWGWKSQYSLQVGLEKTIEFYRALPKT
jgi:GDP-L-fucose synthase